VVELLRQRGNRVFVLVGPFNEYLLRPQSLQRYRQVQTAIVAWLRQAKVPHAVPPALPSDLYGDASHPLALGYEQLARQLAVDPTFRASLRLASGPDVINRRRKTDHVVNPK
jgi:hypothetical protein